MVIPSAFTNPLPILPIRTRTPDNNESLPDSQDFPPHTPGISSLDSGYGSAEPTPVKPPFELEGSFDYCGSYTLDGSVADSSEYRHKNDIDDCPRSALFTPEQQSLGLAANCLGKGKANASRASSKAATQHQPHKARAGLPLSFYSTPSSKLPRRCGSDSFVLYPSTSWSLSSSSASTRAPDRFVHPRDPDCATSALGERFRLTKTPRELVGPEKILRNDCISVDAFFDSTARIIPTPTFADARQAARRRRGWPPQTRTRTTLLPGQMEDDPESEFDQRLMRGSVWSIGTVPPIMGAVNNGNGSLTQTRTATPFYSSAFLDNFVDRSSDVDKHRGRMAAALDFDQASRLLQCNIDEGFFKLQSTKVFPVPVENSKSKQRLQPKTAKTTWDGISWVKEGTKKSEA